LSIAGSGEFHAIISVAAYVPVGSIQKGKELVGKGVGGGGTQCAGCHGPALAGVGGIPALAGRSPSYAVRQLYDFKSGARAGHGSEMMKPVVEKITLQEMIALAAYAASLPPDGALQGK